MSVSFSSIPANIRVPMFYAELDNSAAQGGSSLPRTLMIGQWRSAVGTAVANIPVMVRSDAEARTYFGEGSQLANMCIKARLNDPFGELWAIPITDDPGGTAAAGLIKFATNAATAGTWSVYIGGKRAQIAVTVGETPADQATALIAAINLVDDVEVVATAGGAGECVITSLHKGTLGNYINTRLNYLGAMSGEIPPTGTTCTITQLVGGLVAPALTTAIANMGDVPFDFIGLGNADSVSQAAIVAQLNDTAGRWSPLRKIYGHAFSTSDAAVGSLSTLGNALNSQHLTLWGTYLCPNTPWEITGAGVGQVAKSIKVNPARPLWTLPLEGILPPAESVRMTTSEQNTLLYDGVSPFYVAGGYMRFTDVITTYQVNTSGVADDSYLAVTTMTKLQWILRDSESRITSKYGRHNLANDGTRFGAGLAIVTPSVLRGELVSAYRDYEFQGLVEDVTDFVAHLIVERNGANRVDVLYPPYLIGQLKIFAMLAQFRNQPPAATVV